jgi:SAM-dependent methyltransferase
MIRNAATVTTNNRRDYAAAPSFDLVAKPYQWMERLTFGRALWRCRTHFLPGLAGCRSALILGDGDGRFTAALLGANPHIRIDAVDSSAAMLRLLTQRTLATAPHASTRLHTHHADALAFAHALVPNAIYDLIVTHFFLDCLTQPEVDSLALAVATHLQPGTHWLVSDFRIPPGVMQWPGRALVRSLYFAFRVLTGLRTTHLPDHAAALSGAGFMHKARKLSLMGMLTTELWTYTPPRNGRTLLTMQLPPQRPRVEHDPDPVPDPEPVSPSLPAPDPGVYHPDPSVPVSPATNN